MKIKMLLKTVLSILFISSISTPFAYAGPIMWIDDSRGNIGTVDVATGSATVIGNSGASLTDIAFDPSGNLYGVSSNTLYSIDKSTATATQIGLPFSGDVNVNGLVFSSTGTLYASSISGELYTVDTTTGALAEIFNTGYSSAGDLAFNSGTLYYTSTLFLYSIDLLLHTASQIGKIIPPIPIVANYYVHGLGTADNGTLYAATNNSIYSVNTSTGAGTLVVSTYGNGLEEAYGSAFYTEAGSTVPEPSTFLLFGAGLAGVGLLRRKLRR